LKHVVIALLGRFKGETGENYHLMPVVATTNRGLEPRKWIGRLLQEYEGRLKMNGTLFWNRLGTRAQVSEFEDMFFERLDAVREHRPKLFSAVEEIGEEYGVFWPIFTS